MKKLVLFAVAAIAISLASCDGKGTTGAASATDSIPATPIVEEVAPVIPDSVSADTTVVEVVKK